MKKFYAFLAAALMSAFAFASKDVVPSDEVLQGYYDEGKVCVCFFVPADMACNDIVLTGSFNGWKGSAADCVPTEPVEGYDGWYVGSFEPEAEPSATDGICAKPVMLDVDGNFNWEYQVGAATAIRGGVQVVEGAYAGEIDMKHYSADAPNVFTVDAWKQNPCDAVYHVYTITVISDGCGGLAVPYVVGGMTGWSFTQMQLDVEKTIANGAPTYVYTKKMAEKTPYQVVAGLLNAETGEVEVEPGWNDDSYMQKLIDEVWGRIPGEDGDNLLTHEDPNILFDLRAEDLRWARCAPAEPAEVVAFSVKLPTENIPAAVEVIGGFDDWQGTALTWNPSTDYFEATFEAKASQFFKFRSAGSWDQELELYNEAEDAWAKIADNQLVFSQLWEGEEGARTLSLDFSDPAKARWTEAPVQGIENITLTEKAQKVVVDGVLYIVRDNKMFNAQGTQVR
jgi:hypothetical protein